MVRVVLAVLALLVLGLLVRRRGRDVRVYDAKLAWLRGGIYFCICILLASASGSLDWVLSHPLASSAHLADPGWILFTAGCVAILFVGYFLVWPRGTVSHGRPLNLLAVVLFGGLWGLSEALLFVSVWFWIAQWVEPTWLVAILAFVVISAFNGLWHQFYWDLYVAPDHNIIAWNGRKVLFAHVPNLLVTLTYLALYQNFGIFVIFQAVVLLSSTYFMRFPGFWGSGTPVSPAESPA